MQISALTAVPAPPQLAECRAAVTLPRSAKAPQPAKAPFAFKMSRMVRVARIITRLNIGGPAIQAITLSDRLREHGFETLLMYGQLASGEGDMSYLLRDDLARRVFIPTMQRSVSSLADLRAIAAVLRQLLDFKPHIIHTHTAKAGTVGRAAAFLYNRLTTTAARTVHTYHGHSLEGYFRNAGAF